MASKRADRTITKQIPNVINQNLNHTNTRSKPYQYPIKTIPILIITLSGHRMVLMDGKFTIMCCLEPAMSSSRKFACHKYKNVMNPGLHRENPQSKCSANMKTMSIKHQTINHQAPNHQPRIFSQKCCHRSFPYRPQCALGGLRVHGHVLPEC